jgi:Protein of unknown function (DUF3489)
VRVGLEATGHTRWFERLLAELGYELWIGDEGAALKELMEATEWQAHSVRGFLSGALRKKMGLKIESAKDTLGERRYSIQA